MTMSKFIKNPHKVTPFAKMVSLGCPWASELKERIVKRIEEYKTYIEEEEEFDNLTSISDENTLYERFKDDVDAGLQYGLVQVLKYFMLNCKIKILYDMIGEWKFTETDAEMYNYFRNHTLSAIKPGVIANKICRRKAPDIYVHDRDCKWFVKCDGEREFYTNFFYREIIMLNDIVRNVKGMELMISDRSLFDGKPLHDGLNLSKQIDFGDFDNVTLD
jgi:hypothetical protein